MAVPNLDGMDADELMAFWKRYSRPTRRDAEELVGDRRPGFTTIAGTLACYASNKATAMGCRAKGDITRASTYEQACQLSYDRLPKDLRW